RAAAALENEHIVPIYHVGEADGTPFLVMPLLRGKPLDEHLRQARGALPVWESLHIARQIAAGLTAAHALGLIHRDIKPSNVWLEPGPGGRPVKILDSGLVRAAGEAHLTQSGAVVGTPAYMAPEQARGEPVDARADLFSLGCVLYQMLTGRQPFSGPDVMAALTRLAVETPAEPHPLDPECP